MMNELRSRSSNTVNRAGVNLIIEELSKLCGSKIYPDPLSGCFKSVCVYFNLDGAWNYRMKAAGIFDWGEEKKFTIRIAN